MSRGDDAGGGRCKRPGHSRFGKGQSGNRRGRPKGSKNAAKAYKELLFEAVRIRGSGETMTRFEVMLMVMLRKAHEGNARAKRNLDVLRDACRIGIEPEPSEASGGVVRLSKEAHEVYQRTRDLQLARQIDEQSDE